MSYKDEIWPKINGGIKTLAVHDTTGTSQYVSLSDVARIISEVNALFAFAEEKTDGEYRWLEIAKEKLPVIEHGSEYLDA